MRSALFLIALALVSCGREGISTTAPVIDVQPLAVDFGPIPVGIKVSLPVQVRNLGKSALVLQPATVEGTDFSGPVDSITIGAGDRQSVEVSFLPTVEGVRNGTVHLINNSNNDTDVALVVTGQGIPRLVCAECNAPPTNYCASSSVLISYQAHGSCVMNRCEYQATTTICGGMCVAANNACSSSSSTDAGTDAGIDAGVIDAGTDAGTDAGVDAGVVDAGGPQNTFTTPGVTMWTVPAGITSLTVNAWGGGGAGGVQVGATGGGGASGRATFAVTPGEMLELQVAEGGLPPGNGAGATSILRGSTPLLIVAGGGGGGSDGNSGNSGTGGRGGAGGALSGQTGQNLLVGIPPYCTAATGGQGGTATAGGLGGTSSGASTTKCPGQPGSMGAGGKASGVNGSCDMGSGAIGWQQGGGQANGGGGGGGAGFFGGGGAGFIWTYCSAGGGGGSSFVATGATAALLTGGTDQAQGNAAASQGAGAGGFDGVGGLGNTGGKNGRIVLSY